MLEMLRIVVGPLEVNCYLVHTQTHLYIIDPGDNAEIIFESVRLRKWDDVPVTILLTHAHFDHIGACRKVHDKWNAPVCLSLKDKPLYESPENAMPPFFPPVEDLPPTEPFPDDDAFEVIPTPGHSPGSVCFYFKEHGFLFSGDTLFHMGVGRTDLPGGNTAALYTSIRTKIFPLPSDIRILPGHGPQSDLQSAHQILSEF